MLRDQQESKEWYDLAQEIVRRSESSQDSFEKFSISLPKLLENSQGIVNFKIDDAKVAEIKEALNEYQRLKKIEQHKINKILTDEENRIKEYGRNRRRRSTIPALPNATQSKPRR